jgi:hypothetical protein
MKNIFYDRTETGKDNEAEKINSAINKISSYQEYRVPHRKLHKYTYTSSHGRLRNKIDHVLIDRKRHSIKLYARSFKCMAVKLNTTWIFNKKGSGHRYVNESIRY